MFILVISLFILFYEINQNWYNQIASSQPIFLDSIKSGAKSFDKFVREKVSPLLGLERPEFQDKPTYVFNTTVYEVPETTTTT